MASWNKVDQSSSFLSVRPHSNVGPQQPVDDEALGVPAGDRVLPNGLAPRHQTVVRVVARLGDLDHLHQLHHRDGIEKVESATSVSPGDVLGRAFKREIFFFKSLNLHHVSDFQKGRVGREYSFGRTHGVPLAEKFLLERQNFSNGFHHHVRGLQALLGVSHILDIVQTLLYELVPGLWVIFEAFLGHPPYTGLNPGLGCGEDVLVEVHQSDGVLGLSGHLEAS